MGCVCSGDDGRSVGSSALDSPNVLKAKSVELSAAQNGDSPLAPQRSVVGVTSKTAAPHEKDLLDENPPAPAPVLHHSASASASASASTTANSSAPFPLRIHYFDQQDIHSFLLPAVFSSDRLCDVQARIFNHYSAIQFRELTRKKYPETRSALFVLSQRAMDLNTPLADYHIDGRNALQQKIFLIFVQRK